MPSGENDIDEAVAPVNVVTTVSAPPATGRRKTVEFPEFEMLATKLVPSGEMLTEIGD